MLQPFCRLGQALPRKGGVATELLRCVCVPRIVIGPPARPTGAPGTRPRDG